MRRHGNLWERIIDPENIALAFHRAALNKSWMRPVKAFRENLEENLEGVRRCLESKSPHCLTVQFSHEEGGEKRVFFTGSKVLREQLDLHKDELPFQAVIKKVGRYYTFS